MKARKTFWIFFAVIALLGIVALEVVVGRMIFSKRHRPAQGQRRGPAAQNPNPNRWPNNAPMPNRPSYARAQPAKPRAAERPAGPQAAPPEISQPGGVFTKSFTVEIRAKSASAVIRYTLNGGEPDEQSPAYSSALTVTDTTLVQAKCFEPGLAPSPTATQTYSMLGGDLAEFSSNLPLVVLETFGQYVSHEDSAPVSARFIRPVGNRATLTGPADYDGRGDLKHRGYSSLQFPKQSYTFKAREDAGKVKAAIFDLPADSDWVLYAPYSDKTLLRDALAYELSNQMGRYAARTRFVEVFVNRAGGRLSMRDYAGVYVFEEKIKRGKSRVNIEKLGPDDNAEPNVTGGYIFKRDHWEGGGGWGWGRRSRPASSDGENGFTTASGLQLFFVDPKERELTAPQKQWLAVHLSQFERALYGPNFASPTEGYAKYLDADSFIDHFWLVEMSKNIDGFRYSCYMTKDRGGKIKIEPPWDWNLSFGNADYYDAAQTDGWYYSFLRDSEICWFRRLAQDPEFAQKHVDRWAELRQTVFQPERICRRVDELAAQLNEAQARNFARWRILGRYVKPNPQAFPTWQQELNWMKNWIRQRIAWIDRQFPAAPAFSEKDGPLAPGAKLTLRASGGEIYYTLDGTDPRAPGGEVSKKARRYETPLALGQSAQVVARTRVGVTWSAPAAGKFTAAAAR